MEYFVIEFDSQCIGNALDKRYWVKRIVLKPSTSLRAQLHRAFPQERPGSDNFVHGARVL